MNPKTDNRLLSLESFRKGVIAAGFLLAAGLFIVPSATLGQPQDSSQTAPASDNSGQNKAAGSTADQQSNRNSDRNITQRIRKSIIADKSLSMYAHNVKIITRHGMVTLKGPVKSEDERQAVANKAEAVVGSADMVKNDLTVDNSNN